MGVEVLAAGIGLAGLGIQAHAAKEQSDYRKEATAASQRAEALRAEQMRLEGIRKQRELIRQTQVARATALSRSVNQGAGASETAASSSLFGAFGQIQGAYGRASNAEFQNQTIGAGIFQANADLAAAQGSIATYEGLGKLGTTLTMQSDTIGKIGGSLFPSSSGNWSTTVNDERNMFPGGVGAFPY